VLDASGHKGDARTVLVEWLESHPDSSDARLELVRLFSEPPAAQGQLARK
jgi:hypothetical protein